MLGGVLPTPAVALLAEDLGAVVSASHNPPEYNGVKFFDRDGHKLTDAAEEEIEALLDAPRRPAGRDGRSTGSRSRGRYLEHVSSGSARTSRACGSQSTARTAPTASSRRAAFEELGAEVIAIGAIPTGRTSTSAAARPTSRCCSRRSSSRGLDLGVAFDGDGDRMLAVDERRGARRRRPDPGVLALASGRRARRRHRDDEPRLPPADGRARHPRRHDRRRRPLRARGAAAGGRCARRRASGHVICLARPCHRRRPRGRAPPVRRARRVDARGRCGGDAALRRRRSRTSGCAAARCPPRAPRRSASG